MKSLRIIYIVALVALLSGCGVSKKAAGTSAGIPCSFEYSSVSDASLAGLEFTEGVSATDVFSLAPVLFNPFGSAPMKFNINIEVANPNKAPVTIDGMQYKLDIDGMHLIEGGTETVCSVPASGSAVFPVAVEFNAVPFLIDEDFRDIMLDLIWNLLGTGTFESRMDLEIKPDYVLKNRQASASEYIPVSFVLGEE